MRARFLLAAFQLSLVSLSLGCSTTDGNSGNQAGASGQASGMGGSPGSGGGGASSTAGSTSTAGSLGTAGSTSTAGATSTGGAGNGGGNGNGAGAGNGGSAGGSAGSAGSGGASSAPGCAAVTNAKFCEDWDKLPMGKPSGDYSVSSGVVVDTSKAFSGTQSLHFLKLVAPAGGTPNINFTKQFPLATQDMHGRVMVFMAKTPQTDDHWNFITSRNSGDTEWSIGGEYGNFELVCDPPDHGLDSNTPFPEGKWFCLQWQFKYPGNDDTTFVTKVDGVSVDQGEFTGANSKGEKWQAGTWNNLKFGWEIFGSSDVDVEYWLDDLAFGEQVIPCPAK